MHDGPGSDAGEIGGGHCGGHGAFGGAHGFAPLGHDAGVAGGLGNRIDAAPVTWLPVGIDAGFKYFKETYGHAQVFGYRLGAERSVPGGTKLDARMAEVIALEAGRKYGGADALSPYKRGYLYEHPSISRPEPDEGCDRGRRLHLPGIARSLTTVELLVWPHAACNAKKELRHVLAQLGLVRLDLRMSSSLPDIDRQPEPVLLSANPFATVQDCMNPPNGWFRKQKGDVPTGTTLLWREFYQLKNRFQAWRTGDKDLHGTFLAVFGATWFFEKSADYETRIAFSVYGLPYMPNGHETWKWEIIKAHREAAEKAAGTMYQFISGFPVSAAAIRTRQNVPLDMLVPEKPILRDPFNVGPTPVPLMPLCFGRAWDPEGPEADEKENARK